MLPLIPLPLPTPPAAKGFVSLVGDHIALCRISATHVRVDMTDDVGRVSVTLTTDETRQFAKLLIAV